MVAALLCPGPAQLPLLKRGNRTEVDQETRPQAQHLALRMRSEAHEEGGWVIDSGYVVSGES